MKIKDTTIDIVLISSILVMLHLANVIYLYAVINDLQHKNSYCNEAFLESLRGFI